MSDKDMTRTGRWQSVLAMGILVGAAFAGCAGDGTTLPTDTSGIQSTPSVNVLPQPKDSTATAEVSGIGSRSDRLDGPIDSAADSERPSIHKGDSYELSKLDGALSDLATRYENPPQGPSLPGEPSDASGNTLGYSPIRVSISISGDPASTLQWLEESGVSPAGGDADETCIPPYSSYCPPQTMGDDAHIDAYFSVSLLAPLSVRTEVRSIAEWKSLANLSPSLREEVAQLETGLKTGLEAEPDIHVKAAYLNPTDIPVEICWQVGEEDIAKIASIESAIEWLESKDIRPGMITSSVNAYAAPSGDGSPQVVYSLGAYVPLPMLAELSQENPDAFIARDCGGHFGDGSGGPIGPGGHYSPWLTIVMGRSQQVILFTNDLGRKSIMVEVEEGEDGGSLAIGSCDAPGRNEGRFSHGDTIILAGCSPGEAWVKLYDVGTFLWRKKLWEKRLAVQEPWPYDFVLEPVPASPLGTPPEIGYFSTILKVGESLTLRLKPVAAIPVPAGAEFVINQSDDVLDGNLTVGKCPGGERESAPIGNGDTVTITACSPGVVTGRALHPKVFEVPFQVSIWGEPGAYPTR